MTDGLQVQVQALDRDLNTLRQEVERLTQQLTDVSRQGNQNHTDISQLATKIDQLREDLKGFKDLPNSFVSRDMLNAKLEGYENQLKTLQTNFSTLQNDVSHVRNQLNSAQLTISKDIQTNTQWTIGTLIALIFAVVGVAAKLGH